jgi:phosphoglycolate phosphatase-like HAD superfamily hydrolase
MATAVTSDPLYADFIDLMPLGNRAEDFAITLSALDSERSLPDQAAYDLFRSEMDPEWLQRFHIRFYENRTRISTQNPAAWRQLLGPYPAFVEMLHRFAERTIVALATAKDRRSVSVLLRDYGIDTLFSEDRVLDKETGVHKDAHLRKLQQVFDIPFEQMVFVDDKVNHLDTVASLGVGCALAAWGYNGEREIRLAKDRGYRVLTLANVEEQLFGI